MLMKSLLDRGYDLVVMCPNGTVAALQSSAICATFDGGGHRDYWRYENPARALSAITSWSGVGDPVGWVRHFPSARRQDEQGIYYDKGDLPDGVQAEPCKIRPWKFYIPKNE